MQYDGHCVAQEGGNGPHREPIEEELPGRAKIQDMLLPRRLLGRRQRLPARASLILGAVGAGVGGSGGNAVSCEGEKEVD